MRGGGKSYVTLCGTGKITVQLNYATAPIAIATITARARPLRPDAFSYFYFFFLLERKSSETCVNNVADNVVIIPPVRATIVK